jgi:hypothetical protein
LVKRWGKKRRRGRGEEEDIKEAGWWISKQ